MRRKQQFTPGPWVDSGRRDWPPFIYGQEPKNLTGLKLIALVEDGYGQISAEETKANAAVIKSAPLGLELAEMVVQQMGSEIALELYGPHLGGIVAKARELLSLAKGQRDAES